MSDFELPTKTKSQTQKEPNKVDTLTTTITETKTEETKPKPKYSQEELLQVFDDLIFSGTYTESVTIRGKLKVTFRTRTAEELDTITQSLDSTQANLVSTIMEKRNLLNLYYAVTSYQGKNLSTLKIEEKTKFLGALAAPIIGALMVALSKFDEKVYEASKEGEENF